MQIEMVDLKGQYYKIKTEINQAFISCMDNTYFIYVPGIKDYSIIYNVI
jgi:UDP-2-acetamido-2-deoxy-ribo-hexuluronate aminotransferase